MMMGMNRGAFLAAAAAAIFAVGCGTPTDMDAGTTCTTDSNCGTGKGCHPVLKSCVTTCTSASDCPASEKTCAKVGSSTATFCTCATDALCNTAVQGNVCNLATLQCGAKCTATSCPTGSTCNTTSGVCSAVGGSDGGTDGGTDAGMNMDAGVACNNQNQPDVCGYGNLCGTTMTCQAIADDRTCSNITSSTRPAWTSASTGPVIYRIDDAMPDDTMLAAGGAVCAGMGQTAYTVEIFAYAPAGSTFPMNKSNLPGFFYYNSSGTPTDIPTNLLEAARYQRYANDTVMSARFTLCSATSTGITAGFGFTNGNSVCIALTHN